MANWVGSLHVLAMSWTVIALTSSEGGAGLDVRAAMQLEVGWIDRTVGAFVAVASIIALFLFSTRDSGSQGLETNISLWLAFLACWLLAISTLIFNAQKARENRIARRKESERRSRDAVAQAAASVNALPLTWSCIMILLSCLSYTAPQAIRLALPEFEGFRGVLAGFSNVCFVGHLLMLASNGPPSLLRRSVAHFMVHIAGVACSFGAASRSLGLSVGLTLVYFVAIGCTIFELWLLIRILLPMLATRNPKLHAELPITMFRWLFQRGGLTMALYCYFEALGVGFSDRTPEDISPWIDANNTVLVNFTLSAVLSLTLLADSRTSISSVLRGLAPLHVGLGLAVVFVASLISLTMFAGREFGDHQQGSLYNAAHASVLLLWVVSVGILTAGHASRGNNTAQQALATRNGEDDDNNNEGVTGREERGLSLSAASGGAALATGI